MEIKTETGYTKNIKCADVYTESSAEYVLPDYLGDVRKILFTGAEARPSGRFAGAGEVEFSGIVVYTVVYLDSENDISSVEFTSEYDYAVKCSGERYKDSLSDTRVSNYQIRLIGPRKISAKSSLVGSARVCESDTLTVSGDALTFVDDVETATRTLNVRKTLISSSAEREYAEEIANLDGAICDEVKVIYSEAEAGVDNVSLENDEVCVKGKLRMCAVIKNGDEPAYLAEKVVGYEEMIPFEDASDDMKFIPVITVTSLKSTVNPEETGSSVVLSGIVEFSIVGEKNEEIEVVVDSYLKSCECDNSYEDFSYTSLSDVASQHFSHTAELPRSEVESDSLREVVFLSANPRVESVTSLEHGVKISGEMRYSGVASEISEDGKASYVMLKFSSPFAVNVNLDCQNIENLRFETKVSASGAMASMDAETIYASSNLDVSVIAYEDKCERVLSASIRREDMPIDTHGSKITVYYPMKNDTLFSVAKKYHTSPSTIACNNSLSESVFAGGQNGALTGVKKLIIF
ncbi:MAG: hypothetical protein E7676_07085 [Ruminococcaceae bacterium]|nr:hypothetical protein [Oscillospiraceae bacterium]